MTEGEAPPRPTGAAGEERPLDVPEAIPAIGTGLTGLCRAGVAGSRPFLVEGGALWAAGVEGRAGFRVGTGHRVLARVSTVGFGAAANTLLFPGVIRRDFVAATGPVVETVVVSTRLPLVATRWTSNGGDVVDPGPLLPEVRVELPRDGDGERAVVRRGHQVHVHAGERSTVLAMAPEPLALRLERRDDGSARAVFTPAPGAEPSLLVASGTTDRVRSALVAARHLKAHAVRSAAGPAEGLSVRSGVAEIDDGVLWLRARIAGQSARATRLRLPLGLAAVGTGAQDATSALLARGDDASGSYALLAARVALVFGDLGPASRIARRWVDGEAPPASALGGLAADALARALDRAVPPDLVARLRELASADGSPRRGERRLPTVGGAPADATGSPERRWFASLLEGAPSGPPPPHPRREVAEAREACAGFLTAPDDAWARWRRLLAEETSGGTRILWDPLPDALGDEDLEDTADTGSVAAELLLGLVHGLLGIDPDAPVGRLRMAPRLPSHLTSFSVGGIRVGSCRVALDYRRKDGRHVYELSPEAAPVPPLLVLEASVPGHVSAVEIDGEGADLDLQRQGDRTKVPVQLPLDQARVVVIES